MWQGKSDPVICAQQPQTYIPVPSLICVVCSCLMKAGQTSRIKAEADIAADGFFGVVLLLLKYKADLYLQ